MFDNKGSLSLIFSRSLIAIFAFLIVFVGYATTANVTSLNTQPLSVQSSQLSITSSYFIDATGKLTADSVLEQSADFIQGQANDIPYQLGNQVYWVKFELANRVDQNQVLVLHIDNTMLKTASVFSITDPRAIEIAGAVNVQSAFPHMQVTLAPFQKQQLLIQLQAGGPPDIPLTWYQQDAYQAKESLTRLLFGAAIGVLTIMVLYNLVIFAAIKDKVYLIYIGYLLSAFFVLATVNGFGYLLFSQDMQAWLSIHSLFIHYYLVIFLVLFTMYFLQYNDQKGRLYRIGMSGVGVLVGLSLVTQFFSHEMQAKIFFSLPPIIYAYSLLLVILRIRKQFVWARFYLLSWIPLLIGAAIQPLVLLNYLDYSFLLRNAFLLAVMVEVSLMAFALAERMRRLEQERLKDISYHRASGLPRKIVLENAIDSLIKQKANQFSVLVIKPEHIERVALYVNDAMNIALFNRIYKKLTPLFAYNDAVVTLGQASEKMAYISGNSLAILVDTKKNQQSLALMIESIRTLVNEAYSIDELDVPLSANVGVANYPEHGSVSYALVNRAQLALSSAEQSQEKWAYFAEHNSDKTGYRLELAADINGAIENGEFELYHQPQIDLKTMRVCGSECLIRWHHREEGFIPPDVFIPIAEDMGLINRLTHWVVEQAIEQHLTITEAGFKHHIVAINISAKDIAADGFYEFIEQAIRKAEISASKIALELTESASITDNEQAIATIEKLNELGITISIDDFGTGYSSMAYISQLPFQELKVDRQFVENVNHDAKRQTIAETTVKMGKGLGLEVVAEGINSQLDEDTLRAYGCDIGQGYFYAKPMSLNDYLDWLENEVNGRVITELEGEFIPKSQ